MVYNIHVLYDELKSIIEKTLHAIDKDYEDGKIGLKDLI